jgi:hypothetical protein
MIDVDYQGSGGEMNQGERCAHIGNRHLDLGTRPNAKTSPDRESRDYRRNYFSYGSTPPTSFESGTHLFTSTASCLPNNRSNPSSWILWCNPLGHWMFLVKAQPYPKFSCQKNRLTYCRLCGLCITMSQDTGLFSIKRPREV